jgi:glycopeptide antibiotics resistance protein
MSLNAWSRDRSLWPSRGQALTLWLIYGLVLTYASTVVGPTGMHFVPRDPAEAWDAFLTLHFVHNGSDQRADWMGNLSMLVPYGFLTLAMLWRRKPGTTATLSGIAAIVLAEAVILAIKYAQLFFPPRTVTLNYIAAQTAGAVIGIALYPLWHRWTHRQRDAADPAAWVVTALSLYALALVVFLLEPLDFALNTHDLIAQFARLPATLTSIPGDGRPTAVRAVVLLASTAAFLPIGMLLSFRRLDRWQISRSAWTAGSLGFLLACAVFLLSTLVMGAYPFAGSVIYRTAGVIAGAAMLRWLIRRDPNQLRLWLARMVPWLAVPYLAGVLLVNRLLSVHWQSPEQALSSLYTLGLLPLFDYYIVSKAEAAKNIVGHLLLYAPIGIAMWLKAPYRRLGALAALLATALSLTVEVARYLRPGLEGDFNAIPLAGLAAWLAYRLTSGAWWILIELRQDQANGRQRRLVGSASTPRMDDEPGMKPDAAIEHY